MANAFFTLGPPVNEPVRAYAPGSPEKRRLKAALADLAAQRVEIPLNIGGRAVRTGNPGECRMPHAHGHLLGVYHKAGPREAAMAVDAACAARAEWARMGWEDRAAIFMKAAALLAGPRRDRINAATMLGQSKNVFQAEIDAACELVDFFRFNCYFATQLYRDQPYSPTGVWNRVEYRGLEGFVFAVTPFNFTSIAGNLPAAPALMGNAVVWKPASSAVYSGYHVMQLLMEAGVPPGVINFVPGSGAEVGDPVLASELLAGVHFTGSTTTFRRMWKTIGGAIDGYRGYPRIVGETGGKDFVFAHESADVEAVATALVRGAFEYQGQKCSAASRAYLPDTLWKDLRQVLIETTEGLAMGPPEDFTNFVNAVIDRGAYGDIKAHIDRARASAAARILAGGQCDDSAGYFIRPTIIEALEPDFPTMVEEIFGPVLTVYVYPADKYAETLRLCDATSPYALTGAVFARDRRAIVLAADTLVHAAGNFYINDKPTGAVVGQQPFGGGRASGTNDKAGSALNLARWVSPRTIKETFAPPADYRYPYMEEA